MHTFVSIVIPMHNEAPVLSTLEARLNDVLKTLNIPVEIICVDDGSHDDTWAGLLAWQQRDPRLNLVRLSRNFGHEAAILAGLKQAKGDAIITMDADLQDPPELIPALLSEWEKGFEVVYAVREDRSVDTWLKRVTSDYFYKILNRLSTLDVPGNTAEYRLMSRRVVHILLSMPEKNSFVRMMTRWVGFSQTTIGYKREPRAAGVTKYNVWKLWNYALGCHYGIQPSAVADLELCGDCYFLECFSLCLSDYCDVLFRGQGNTRICVLNGGGSVFGGNSADLFGHYWGISGARFYGSQRKTHVHCG